jgi:hypothetical protein
MKWILTWFKRLWCWHKFVEIKNIDKSIPPVKILVNGKDTYRYETIVVGYICEHCHWRIDITKVNK